MTVDLTTSDGGAGLFGDLSLAAKAQELQEAQKEEVQEETEGEELSELTQEKRSELFLEQLKDFPGAPSSTDLDSWRSKFGMVSASVLGDEEVFVWRTLSREEHKRLQPLAARIAEQGEASFELVFEELIVETCMLWLSPEAQSSLKQKGGTASTLAHQIMFHSNFLNPQVAASLVVQL